MSEPFVQIVGQKAQGCWIGHGSVLFLEFGQLRDRGDGGRVPRGEWTLSSDLILWRVEEGDRVIGASEDDREPMEAAIQHINGRTLLEAQLEGTSGDSILTFSGNIILRTFVLAYTEDSRWRLRLPDGQYLLIGPEPSMMGAS